ncbi:rod shape-determining protein MreD [Paracidobacterium acidisoli]|uniref:Rod shape-determining protein MreD n=1 Tax=Paracidobacterium acidisoli TaxID=2303751 RepID=A0A372IPK5_9BACT|nr:rod shape-determining protein MreD [Paracidobacterium acidisoli]MBT9331192.1 rod shape-determining protein MreD [Paracidobacterium acidisoli]
MVLLASTRREADQQSLPLPVMLLVPLVALGLQSLITLHFPLFDVVDLPLLVTVYFAMTWRNPISATVAGALIGVAQDVLTQHPLGVFGIGKSVVGYLAASLGVRIDTENHGTRLLVVFISTLLHSGIFWLLQHRMLAQPLVWNWLREVIRAVVNALVALILFALLDKTKRRD